MGKGGAQLGKPVKGRSREAKKDKAKAKEDNADRQLTQDMKMLEEYERLNKLADAQRLRLKRLQQQEMHNTKLNSKIITNIHRQFMRSEKVASLRKEIEILAQNHEREVDRKDAIIQMLAKDLDDAEEQFEVARRAHFSQMEEFSSLHKQKMATLDSEFEQDLKVVKAEFLGEFAALRSQHAREMREMTAVIAAVEAEDADRVAQAQAAHETERERLRSANEDQAHETRVGLESRIEDMEKQFDDAFAAYAESTQDKNTLFRQLQQEDRRLTQRIQRRKRKIERLQDELRYWRRRIELNQLECEQRNGVLREQKDALFAKCTALKRSMKLRRVEGARRLTDLSLMARAARQSNEDRLAFAERLLHMAELARKFETEREKVMPFDPAALGAAEAVLKGRPAAEGLLPAAAAAAAAAGRGAKMAGAAGAGSEAADGAASSSSAAAAAAEPGGAADGSFGATAPAGSLGLRQSLGDAGEDDEFVSQMSALARELMGGRNEWGHLDAFYGKYNKVLLDKLAITQERGRLLKENTDLRAILKQYLDGIAITEDAVEADNPLLIVNGRVNVVNKPAQTLKRQTVTVEATQVARNYAVQARM